MAAWKDLERTTAEISGGIRLCRGANFSKSSPEVDHPIFIFECKYRNIVEKRYSRIFDFIRFKEKVLIIYHRDRVILKRKDWIKECKEGNNIYENFEIPTTKKYSTFLERTITQAIGYSSEKIPIVVYKSRGMWDAFVYLKREDWDRICCKSFKEYYNKTMENWKNDNTR